jgi:enolase
MLSTGAVSEWFKEEEGGYYLLPKAGKRMSRSEMVGMWKGFTRNTPSIQLRTAMAEDDWEGWKMLTDALGKKVSD